MAHRTVTKTLSTRVSRSSKVAKTKRMFTPLTSQEYTDSRAWGMATAVDIHDCDPSTIRDAEGIKLFTKILCEKIGMKRFGETTVVNFGEDEKVAGFSMTQLIETSLISAHFANQTNSVYLDVFSCKFYEAQLVIDYALEFFKGKTYNAHCLLRGCAEFPKEYQKGFSGRNIVLNSTVEKAPALSSL